MTFKIHFEVQGVPDEVIISGDSIDEIRDKAQEAVQSRNGENAWSEEVNA